jgi:hypothetical protein
MDLKPENFNPSMRNCALSLDGKICGGDLLWQPVLTENLIDYEVESAFCPNCTSEYQRRANGKVYYVTNPNSNEPNAPRFLCGRCTIPIFKAQVQHVILPLSKGNILIETVPYCPGCEEKPGAVGSDLALVPRDFRGDIMIVKGRQ